MLTESIAANMREGFFRDYVAQIRDHVSSPNHR
jgi:hypothetical protein